MDERIVMGLMDPTAELDLLDLLRPPPQSVSAKWRTVLAALAEVCDRCEVRDECLQTAVEEPQLTGCWGGTTDAQRRALRRSLAA